MRTLWQLPRAAPLLWRHLGAYAELATQDLARARAMLRVRVAGVLILALGVAGCAVMLCVAIIAAHWDTPSRMTAIYSLMAFFLIVAVSAAAYGRYLRGAQPPLFAQLRQEWCLDQPILARIVSGDSEPKSTIGQENDDRQD